VFRRKKKDARHEQVVGSFTADLEAALAGCRA
jgi:hypothetical protein